MRPITCLPEKMDIIIKSIGQATFLINYKGRTILTDPWFGNFLRKIPLTINPDDIQKCDIMLVSHPHIDHLDKKALFLAKKLNSTFAGPKSAGKKAEKFGVKNIIFLEPYKEVEIHSIKIYPIKAYHTFSSDSLCFVLGGERKIFFSGDTKLHNNLLSDLKKFKIDIALVQICCAYYPEKDGMNLPDAVSIIKEIRPKVAIPMHYHMYLKSADPQLFKEKLKNDLVKVDILSPGEAKEY